MTMALKEAGLPVLEPLDIRPFQSNPQGHFEHYKVRELNEAIIKNFQQDIVEAPGLLPFLNWDVLRNWLESQPETFIVKDPRLASTWPIWYRTTRDMGREMVALWCRRDFGEQIKSLMKYRLTEKRAADCAKMHELCAKAASDMIPTLEVWLDDPERVDKAIEWFCNHGVTPNAENAVTAEPVPETA